MIRYMAMLVLTTMNQVMRKDDYAQQTKWLDSRLSSKDRMNHQGCSSLDFQNFVHSTFGTTNNTTHYKE